jgi:hypothetical protein
VRKRYNVMGRPSAYPEEFRADAVRLVADSTPAHERGCGLGAGAEPGDATLCSWAHRAEKEKV